MTDVIVLGAGIVGVCVAIHLQRRGRNVLLVDRREPGRETSYGNAGIIQREGVRPRAFPRDLKTLLRIAANGGLDSRYELSALPGYASPLAQYWWHSAPDRYRRIVADYLLCGGETVFPQVDCSVVPQRGQALYFEYGNGTGRSDPASLHASAPVLAGEKWIATKWIRTQRFVPRGETPEPRMM